MEERAGRGGDDLTSHGRLGHVFPKVLVYYNPPCIPVTEMPNWKPEWTFIKTNQSIILADVSL